MMHSEGYKKLIAYQEVSKLRREVYLVTEKFAKTHPKLVSQTRDAARSAKQNIAEGYAKDSVGTFIQHLKISLGSLSEVEGDVNDYFEDSLITKEEHLRVNGLIKRSQYLIDRLVRSLIKLNKEGKWQ